MLNDMKTRVHQAHLVQSINPDAEDSSQAIYFTRIRFSENVSFLVTFA